MLCCAMQELPVELGGLRLRQLTVKGNPLHQPFARYATLLCVYTYHT